MACKALFAGDITYVVAFGFSRVSAALFVGQLTRHRPQVRAAYILAGGCGLWLLASTLTIAFRGDLSKPWETLDGSSALWYRWIAIEAVGVLIELGIWAMSISLIWGLQMRLDKRLVILGAFGCRLGFVLRHSMKTQANVMNRLIPLVVIRLVLLSPNRNSDPTYTSALPAIVTEAALEFALFSTSITALKPFLRPFHTGAIVNTVGGAGSGLAYASKGSHGIYMLSSTRDHKEEHQMNIATVTANRSEIDVSNPVAQSPKVSRQVAGFKADSEDIESIKSEGASDEMIIRTTKDWSVRYEYR